MVSCGPFTGRIALIAALLIMPARVALADAIDGDWCHADGRHLSIHGPDIVTPGGTHMKGEYDRHGFAYVVPATEPGAGTTMTMVLLSELQMRMNDPNSTDQMWRRCGKPIS